MKVRCRRTSSRGRSVLQSIAKVRLLEATMSVTLTKGVLKLHSIGHPGGERGARKIRMLRVYLSHTLSPLIGGGL